MTHAAAQWQPVIGLELHVQLATRSNLFSGSDTHYGAEPNAQASAVDLGYPGTLPVPNAEAVRMAVRFGLAVDGHVAERSIFARKNYFYPDLPKGYQISQYEQPVVAGGLPIGLQMLGAPFTEETLLRAAHGYEQATDWHTRAPAL